MKENYEEVARNRGRKEIARKNLLRDLGEERDQRRRERVRVNIN